MKKLALALGSLLFLLVGAAVIAPSLMDWNQYKAEAQTRIKALTGYDVALNGDLSISLLPSPKAYASNIVVKAVPGAKAEALASFERLDLHLAILPLFSGKIAISQISFVKPVIAIEALADGRQSWQTPELDALIHPKALIAEPGTVQPAVSAEKSSNATSGFDISVQNFTVEDGRFSFTDKAAGTDITLSTINLGMSAESLSGPFTGHGKVAWNGQVIDFDAQSGRFGTGTDSVAINAKANLADALAFEYAGVAGTKGGLDLQGEISLKISDLQKLAKAYGADLTSIKAASLELKGVLNATPKTIAMKDMVLDLAGDKFTGSLEGALGGDTPVIKTSLIADKPVNLDNFLNLKASDSSPGFGGSADNGKGSIESSGFLPASISLPALHIAADLKAPALIYKGEEFRDVSFALANSAAGASINLSVGAIPGQGKLDLTAGLKQESGKLPSLAFSVKGSTKNLPYTLEVLDLGIDPKSAEHIKSLALDLSANLYKDRIDFGNSTVEIDGTPLAFSGSYALKGASGKPVLRLNAAAGSLDLDKFSKSQPVPDSQVAEVASQTKALAPSSMDLKNTLATLSLPFDFNFDVSAENLGVQGYEFKGLVASGQWIRNSVTLNGFSVKDFAGAAVQAKGKVENIQSLEGVDLTLGAQASDVRAVAKVLKLDVSSLPANLGRTDISAALKGSLDNLSVLANIKALNGEVIVQGGVADPLGKMKADKLSLQVKHRSVNEAINIFSPGSGSYASLNGPLDFYTDVQIADNVTHLNNIKAKLAGTSLEGKASVNTGASKPDVSGTLTFDDLVIQSTAASSTAGSLGGGSSGSGSGAGPQWSREAIDTAWMQSVNFDISLSGNSLKYEGWDLAKPIIKASLKDGMLRVDQMDAGMFQGQIAMKASVQAGKGERQPLQVQADAKIRDVSLEPLVKAFVGVPLIKGAGQINMDSVINASGISPAALVYDLSGNGVITGKDIVLEGLDLTRFAKAMSDETKPGDTVLGLWKGATKGGSTQFDKLDGEYTIQEGIINISKMDLDGPKAAIDTTGKIDLPKWYIDTAHKIIVKGEDVPEFTVKLSGSLSNPVNTFGEGLLNDYLQRKLTRKLDSVIQDKLGKKLDGKLGGVLSNILGTGATTQQPSAQTPTSVPTVPVAEQPGVPANTNEPAAGGETIPQAVPQPVVTEPAVPAQQQEQPVKPEDAIKGLLKGLIH